MNSTEIRTKKDCLEAMKTVREFIATDEKALETADSNLSKQLRRNNLDRQNDLEFLQNIYPTLPEE